MVGIAAPKKQKLGVIDQENRRRNFRIPVIVVEVKIDDGKKTFCGYAKNISRGGMFIASSLPPSPGDRLRVEFILPEPARVIQTTCEVVWNRCVSRGTDIDPGMGLRFLDLPENHARDIEHWVNAAN